MALRLNPLVWVRACFLATRRFVWRVLGVATKSDLDQLETRLMANLDQLLAKVLENRTVLGSLNTLLDGLRAQVNAILAGEVIPATVQAKIDAVFEAVTATGEELAEVVLENTPAAPPPTP